MYNLISKSTISLWLTKTELDNLKSTQLGVSNFIDGSMNEASALKLMKSTVNILTSVFKIGVAGDILNEITSYASDAAKKDKDALYDGSIAGWETMYNLLNNWNSKIGLFKENIVKVELTFPVAVYKHKNRGTTFQIINGSGYQSGAIDANGNRYLM